MLRNGRSFTALLIVFISIIALSDFAAAGEQLLFDEDLTVSRRHGHASRHRFHADGARQARIVINKITPHRELRRGFFVLNGAFTSLRAFLIGDEQVFEKNVKLRAANRLRVYLWGRPGAKISFKVIADDATTPAPEITFFTADPPTINHGEATTLAWQTVNTDSCAIEPDIGPVVVNGSFSVSPSETTTYTITASGPGGTASASVTVTVNPLNNPPVADAGPDQQVLAGTTVALDGGGSRDPNSDPLTYQWSFVSVPPESTAALSDPIAANPTFVADVAGTYEARLIVNDGSVDSAPDTVIITANPTVKVPSVVGMLRADAESVITAASLAVGTVSTDHSANVPADHVISQDPPEGTIVGEGAAVDLLVSLGPVMVTVPNVVGQTQADAEFVITDANLTVGAITHESSDTVPSGNVISQNPAAGTSVAQGSAIHLVISLGPANTAPVANDDSAETDEDTPVVIAVLTNDVDTDNDTLSVTQVTQGTKGAVTINPDSTIRYVPMANVNGADSFTYTASDGRGGTDTARVDISVIAVNDAPVANAQSIAVNEDTNIAITLNGSDVENDPLSYSVASGPDHGILGGTAPNLTYTPVADYQGADVFTFTVNDGWLDSEPATVTITVNPVNDPPVAVDDTAITDEDNSVVIDVAANDTDADGDSLVVAGFTQPASGTVAMSGGSLIYTPDLNFNGTDSFAYTVNDGTADSQPATVALTINPINDAPVADAGKDQTVTVGETVSLDAGESSDVDGDNLTYQWSFFSKPQGSIASLSDAGAVNPTFVADLEGSYTIQLIVNDGTLNSNLGTVLITASVQTVQVPDVVGLLQSNAESTLTGANLAVGAVDTANSSTVPAGHVISQDPAAGTSVPAGTAVDLVVSLGPVLVTVPDVVGQTQTNAQTAITGANLTVGTITTENSAIVPVDHVISQDPAAGTSIAEGAAVNLLVSLGPAMVTVPDVVGQVQADAEAAIIAAGLIVGTVTTANSDTVPAGQIISQNPAAGVSVVQGSAVDLVVSLGPGSLPPTVDISANPDTILPGRMATLSWISTNADTASIDQGIGAVPVNGDLSVTPTATITYTITATGPGGSATDSVTVTVDNSIAALVGTVTDATSGEPIQGVTVTVTDSDKTQTGVTDSNGDYYISNITPGQITAMYAKEGYATSEYILILTGGVTSAFNVSLSESSGGAALTGLVTDSETGQPLEGATITVFDTDKSQSTQSLADGTYYIAGITPGDIEVNVSLEGYLPFIYFVNLPSAQVYAFDIALSDKVTLNGIITSAISGQPLEGATVAVTDADKTQTAQSFADGYYEIAGITSGDVSLTVTHPDYLTERYQSSFIDNSLLTLDFALHDTITLFGFVTDAQSGQPLEGATVTVTDADKTLSFLTAADGFYEITDITPGDIEISATKEGYLPQGYQISLTEDSSYRPDFALYSLSALVTVTGTVTNSKTLQGEPGVSIRLKDTENITETGADGTFTLTNVPPGQQSLEIFKEDFVNTTWSFTVSSDPHQLDLIFPLIKGVAHPADIDTDVTGYVYDASSGKPLAGAVVQVPGSAIETTSDANGQYSLSGLPPGEIRLIAMAVDHEAVEMRPTVIDGAADTFDFNLPAATKGWITGTITDAATGEPIRYAEVNLGQQGLLSATTEADGTFTLVGAPAGEYAVTATHPEYLTGSSEAILVQDDAETSINFALTRVPEVGDLQGVITDTVTGGPVANALLSVEGTTISGTTDENGYYYLGDLPAGLVTITIDAQGYPLTSRTTAVMAHENNQTATVTTADFQIDAADATPPDSVSELITAADGGSIVAADSRFMMVIPPGVLSDDAIVTLMFPADGPEISPGDELDLDPELNISGIRALGSKVQVVVEPAVEGGQIPTIQGGVVLGGCYFQSQVDEFDIDESTIFPYYWDGTQWTVMRMKPHEMLVDRINNLPLAVVDFTTTESGDPVIAKLGTKEPILLASLAGHIPDLEWAATYTFILGGWILDYILPPQPNVDIYDIDRLLMVPMDPTRKKRHPTDPHSPYANSLPLLVFSGWDTLSAIINTDGSDPNADKRYYPLLEDIVKMTNGVYRPMFAKYNTRSSMLHIGKEVARQFHGANLAQDIVLGQGTAGAVEFPYIDTLGFSMGGLISRSYQASGGKAHNMVIIATPNHGTFKIVHLVRNIVPLFWRNIIDNIKIDSPGTADLLAYDDRDPILLSENPRLQRLNENPKSMPGHDLTLIAGTDSSGILGYVLPKPNDGVVPVDSVLCRTSSPTDPPETSLLSAGGSGNKSEYTFGFSHKNFAIGEFRIGSHPALKDAIMMGLSDWLVGETKDDPLTPYPDNEVHLSTETQPGFARVRIRVDFNNWSGVTTDAALVIYAQDNTLDEQWYIAGGDAQQDGRVIQNYSIAGNSIDLTEPLIISAYTEFPEHGNDPKKQIKDYEVLLIHLTPGQTHVPTTPKAGPFVIN